MKCPICSGDRLRDMEDAKALVRAAGLVSEHVNPGGRRLEFSDGRALQLEDMCNACDAQKIFLALTKDENWASDNEPLPDHHDEGKRVRVLECPIDGGRLLEGELELVDWFFTGEDEIPILRVRLDDGATASLVAAVRWRYA